MFDAGKIFLPAHRRMEDAADEVGELLFELAVLVFVHRLDGAQLGDEILKRLLRVANALVQFGHLHFLQGVARLGDLVSKLDHRDGVCDFKNRLAN